MCHSTETQCQYRSVCCDGDCPCRLSFEDFSKDVFKRLQEEAEDE
jgi:hypothetical protein